MKYSVQGSNVEWFLSNDHMDHLFKDIDLRTNKAAIKVRGSWREGLTFKPVIMKSSRGNDGHTGNFIVEQYVTSGDELFRITVPRDQLKLSYTNSREIRQKADVATTNCADRSIIITPTRYLNILTNPLAYGSVKREMPPAAAQTPTLSSVFGPGKNDAKPANYASVSSDAKTANVANADVSDKISNEEALALLAAKSNTNAAPIQTSPPLQPKTLPAAKVPEPLQPTPTIEPLPTIGPEPFVHSPLVPALAETPAQMPASSQSANKSPTVDLELVQLVLEEINGILSSHPNITATVEEDGKLVKLLRAARKRIRYEV